jgi:threonine dehydratase
MFVLTRQYRVNCLLVSDTAIQDAQRRLWQDLRIVAEPGGATALAALTSGVYQPAPGERVGVLICGGNTDPGTVG